MLFTNALELALAVSALVAPALARSSFSEKVHAQGQRHAALQARAPEFVERDNEKRSNFRYLNSKTKKFQVHSLPDVNYDIGEMYSGQIPIDESNPDRNLFFVWQPTVGAQVDEVTIWLNGGPGCSSLEGFFQENGRFVWWPGTDGVVQNDYSWVNQTNMLWVEQPVGTGFSTGKVTAKNEVDVAKDFVSWFKNWQTTFGIKNYKIFVTGESYAGRYVPYISAQMLDQKDTEYYGLEGALVYDPCIGNFDYTQEEVWAVPFVNENANLFNFNQTFMDKINSLHQSCGYADLIDEYFKFPPAGHQPAEYYNFSSASGIKCDVFDDIVFAALPINPCWNVYEVNTMCPLPYDALAFPTSIATTNEPYFNRTDVKKAMHAPLDVNWAECSGPVFKGNGGPEQGEDDTSPDPIQGVLPQVIEGTNRTLIGNGDYDMIIITNGTLMSIQNMTWNGKLGFQTQPSTPINIHLTDLQYEADFDFTGYNGVDGAQGVMGIQHFERGLMWVESYQSGHMQPQFQPRLAYRHLLWLRGKTQTI